MVVEDHVAVALLVEGELVLEAGAAAAAHADPQAGGRRTSASWDARNSRTFSAPLSVNVTPLAWYVTWVLMLHQSIAVATLAFEMPTADELKHRIEAAIPERHRRGRDRPTTCTSAPRRVAGASTGSAASQQHRMVYDVFGDEIGGAIHALSLKTETP